MHEFWFNGDGWPVVSPLRYADGFTEVFFPCRGRVAAAAPRKGHQHISARSKAVQLKPDGTISGEMSGTWDIKKGLVTVDGETYQGLFDADTTRRRAMGANADDASASGEALWGIQG